MQTLKDLRAWHHNQVKVWRSAADRATKRSNDARASHHSRKEHQADAAHYMSLVADHEAAFAILNKEINK